jgi:hypothetical protein
MKEKMKPCFSEVIPLLVSIAKLEVKGGNQAAVSEAMQSLGKICVNCMDLQEFGHFIKPLIPTIYQRMVASQEPQIREASLAFFYNIAGCLKETFGDYINDLVPFTLRILEQNNEF